MHTIATLHDAHRHITRSFLDFAATFVPEGFVTLRIEVADHRATQWAHTQLEPDDQLICAHTLHIHFEDLRSRLVLTLAAIQIWDGTLRFIAVLTAPGVSKVWGRQMSAFGVELKEWYDRTLMLASKVVVEPEEHEPSRTIASVYLEGVGERMADGVARIQVATVHPHVASAHPRQVHTPGECRLHFLVNVPDVVQTHVLKGVRGHGMNITYITYAFQVES